jgi:aminoglycoside 6'-N-acetyltransferase I
MRLVRCSSPDPRWADCRERLWPEATLTTHQHEIERLTRGLTPFAAWLALVDEDVAGFAETLLRRDPVNGCESSPVAFLEGLWVAPPYRRRGVARALIGAAEEWARSLGCAEFASDALIDNAPSHATHMAGGFEETERVVCYRKKLAGAEQLSARAIT